jgi:hypothetical protein
LVRLSLTLADLTELTLLYSASIHIVDKPRIIFRLTVLLGSHLSVWLSPLFFLPFSQSSGPGPAIFSRAVDDVFSRLGLVTLRQLNWKWAEVGRIKGRPLRCQIEVPELLHVLKGDRSAWTSPLFLPSFQSVSQVGDYRFFILFI